MKIDFIKDEIFILTTMGAFGRNNIYKHGSIESDKKQFRKNLKSLLVNLGDLYKKKISESEHLAILEILKKDIENQNKNILVKKKISFGTVQKLLNLYLKYLWCVDLIAEPPHCPIDRTILNKIKDYKTSWTKMDRRTYCQAIESIRGIKGKISFAEWELMEFRRK